MELMHTRGFLELAGFTGHHPLTASRDNSAIRHRLKVKDRPQKFPTWGAAVISETRQKSNKTFKMAKAKGRAKQFQDLDETVVNGMFSLLHLHNII
jgi:hypothetical protein